MRRRLARLTAWWAFRSPAATARLLLGFCRAERNSELELLAAARSTTRNEHRALYLRHAIDESRHADLFFRRANAADQATAPMFPDVDTDELFARLGERDFLAFVHNGERDGAAQFRGYVEHFRARVGDAADPAKLFAGILVDEDRHESTSWTMLVACCDGDERVAPAVARDARMAGRSTVATQRPRPRQRRLRRRDARAVRVVRAAVALVAPSSTAAEGVDVSVVLGASGLYHDAAVALVVNGVVVGALQQERVSRIKNDPRLPIDAARAVLAQAGIAAGDVDEVAFYENPYARLEHVLVSTLRGFPRTFRQFPRAMASQLSHKLWVKDDLAAGVGIDRKKVTHVGHHESHAASTFFASGAARATILCVDGVGEDTSTSIWRGDGTTLQLLRHQQFPHSLGLFYAAITAWLGFRVMEGEQQVMGLAACGAPRFLDEMQRLARGNDDGSVELDLSCFAHHTDDRLGYSDGLVRLLGPPRERGRPWRLRGDDVDAADVHYADVAASAQAHLESLLLTLAQQARVLTGIDDTLCLAGGVALNACANSRLHTDAGYARVFVQPAAGDAGGALGAAYLASLRRDGTRPQPMTHAALGPSLSTAALVDTARAVGLSVTTTTTPAEVLADHVLAGRVTALVDGRSEWGPRALGHRSLIAAPGPRAMQDRINTVIKRREPFRPFAPAVLSGHEHAHFDGVHEDLGRFMTGVASTKPAMREALGAVTHDDGSARVQVVDAHAPVLAQTLAVLHARGAPPVVLNTSLNGRREPVCQDAVDVIRFFIAHGNVDAIIADDVLITRP